MKDPMNTYYVMQATHYNQVLQVIPVKLVNQCQEVFFPGPPLPGTIWGRLNTMTRVLGLSGAPSCKYIRIAHQ